jgi:hypothetical protein
MCLSKSQDDDSMAMCLSESQDDDSMMMILCDVLVCPKRGFQKKQHARKQSMPIIRFCVTPLKGWAYTTTKAESLTKTVT